MDISSWVRSALDVVFVGKIHARRSVWSRVGSRFCEIQTLEEKVLLSAESGLPFEDAVLPFIIRDSGGNIQYNSLGSQDLSSLSPQQRQQLIYGPWEDANSPGTLFLPSGSGNGGIGGPVPTMPNADGGYVDGGYVGSVDGMQGDYPTADVGTTTGGYIGDGGGLFGVGDMPTPDGGRDYSSDQGSDIGSNGDTGGGAVGGAVGGDLDGGGTRTTIQIRSLSEWFLEGPYSRYKTDRAKLEIERTGYWVGPPKEAPTVTMEFSGTAELGADYRLADKNGETIPLMHGVDGQITLTLDDNNGVDTFFLISAMDGDFEPDETVIVTITDVSGDIRIGDNKKAVTTLMDFTGDIDLGGTGEVEEDAPGVNILWNNDDDNDDDFADFVDGVIDLDDDDLVSLEMRSLLLPAADHIPYAWFGDYAVETNTYYFLTFDENLIEVYNEDGSRVVSGVTRFVEGQDPSFPLLKVEGIGFGHGQISFNVLIFTNEAIPRQVFSAQLDSLRVNVWGLDLDVDSDNNNGFDYPDNSHFEEFLEDKEYAIGKMLTTEDSHFTPMRLRLPGGLEPRDGNIRVLIQQSLSLQKSGIVNLWTTYKSDPARNPASVTDGGHSLGSPVLASYTLQELGYDPSTGAISLWMEADWVSEYHDTKREVDVFDNLHDVFKATLLNGEDRDLIPGLEIADTVKYKVVIPASFYPTLNDQQRIRSALGAELVYGQRDAAGGSNAHADPLDGPKWALRLVPESELAPMLEYAVHFELISPQIAAVILDNIYTHEGTLKNPGQYVQGFKAALYFDYVTGGYVLSFRGTNFTDAVDWLNNLGQGASAYSPQYLAAMQIANGLNKVPGLRKWRIDAIVLTGHSLGGGLAAAAAVATGLHAETFNAAGLSGEELFRLRTRAEELVEGAVERFRNAELYVDQYFVWLQPHVDGPNMAPDILTWLQLSLNRRIKGIDGEFVAFLADAVGVPHALVGMEEISNLEYRFILAVEQCLDHDQFETSDLLTLLPFFVRSNGGELWTLLLSKWLYIASFFYGLEVDASVATSALTKMAASHGMEHVFHGLMTGPGWNVYDVPSFRNGGNQD